MKPFNRSSWLPAIPIFILNLGGYLAFLPDQMSWAHFGNDGGDYLAAVLTRGVAHPTGYPTYLLLNLLFQQIPISTPYWRGAFFSACMAALSSALLYLWLIRQLEKHGISTRNYWIAALGCLAWASSPFLFSQAVIVDVHSLHAVFLILGFFWVDALSEADPARTDLRSMGLLAFLFGLGLGNHITLILFLPAAVYAAWKYRRSERGIPLLTSQLGALVLGLLVYLYLPWSASRAPAVNWGNPQTLAGFAWLVSGEAYKGMLLSVPPVDILPRLATAAKLLIAQTGVLGILLGAAGAVSTGIFRKEIALSLAWCALVFSLFALTYAAVDWTTYLLPLQIVWCAWIGAGLHSLWTWHWRGQPLGILTAPLFAAILIVQLPATLRNGDPRPDHGAFDYVQSLFAQAPRAAIILTGSDLDSFPLWYYHLGLKQRPDLHIVVRPLTVFDWYRETVHQTYPDLEIPPAGPADAGDWENLLIRSNPNLPVCQTTVSNPPDPGVTFTCNR